MNFTYDEIAKMVDHALLTPTLTDRDIEAGCHMARNYNCASVCIMPFGVLKCAEILRGSTVKTSTTIAFPHGGHTTAVKVAESQRALDEGCEELDMVVNISKVLSGDWDYIRQELKAVIDLTHAHQQKLKVIFENCFLQNAHKIRLCEISAELGADWVKTSTGFGSSGATPEDVKLMRAHSPAQVQVKASGGIRDLDHLLAFRQLGATRIGASKTKDILEDCRRRLIR